MGIVTRQPQESHVSDYALFAESKQAINPAGSTAIKVCMSLTLLESTLSLICVKKSLEFSHFWAMLLALDKCFHVQLYLEVSRIAVCDHIPRK